ncbi:MAG TPA: RNA polymerase factor sigma-54 [Syntrophales bacterium]|nr:RNA polymerase factor sigma-54 [Syntrophales bacterium]
MAFELRQTLKLTQQLVMTPQLQQAIKLLQLSRLEMMDAINQEIEENPLLEEISPEESPETERELDSEEDVLIDREETKQIDRTEELTGEGDGKEDFDWNNYLEDYRPAVHIYDRREGEQPSWDNVIAAKPSLMDHLLWQLGLSRFTELERRVGEQIIGNIDQDGYLRVDLQELAVQEKVDVSLVEGILSKVQEFDPPGIAARDLKECLLIQAKMLGLSNSLVLTIIQEHLHALEKKDYNRIARKMKVPPPEVVQAVMLITSMNPKPGSVYADEKAQCIIPDVYIFKAGDEYKIILNDDGLPQLRISNYYRDIMVGMDDKLASPNGKRYIKEKLQSAGWLIKSIQQRQKTIYRVTESIVKFQKEFFDDGINYLKPLVLRDIADDVEMHESTISRVVTNKYVHSPRGVFELKYFFGSSINTNDGNTIASKSVKEEIRKIIAGENHRSPYSDQEIVEVLAASGVNIARRTIAKYREMMRILPSSRRKKYF